LNQVSTFFDDLWDKANGVFDKVIDFKLQDLEIDRAREQQLYEFNLRKDELGYQTYPASGGVFTGSAGTSNTVLWAVGALAVAGVAVVLLKD
jgi:hypothetical protein